MVAKAKVVPPDFAKTGEALGAREALKLCLQATIIKFIWVYYF